jgi:hypothetical protein
LDIKKVIPGDFVLFDWETGKWIGKNQNTDHIGIVVSVNAKKNTVTYVSADTGKVIPGIVTMNTVNLQWVAGFARLVNFAEPVSVLPAVHQGQRDVHSATSAPANVAPAGAPSLVTLHEITVATEPAPVAVHPTVVPSEPAHVLAAAPATVPAVVEAHPHTQETI